MTINYAKAETAAKALSEAAESLEEAADNQKPETRMLALLEEVQTQNQALLAAMGIEDQISFTDFLRSVGEGMVDSQEQLDVLSRGYLQRGAQKPYVLPTVFRIPTLTADIKFALQTSSKKTTNLIFYRKENQATTMHQQSLQFEIAAVPPPPEVMSALSEAQLDLEFELAPSSRQRVFEAIAASPDPTPKGELGKKVLLAPENSARVVMLKVPLPAASPPVASEDQGYFLAYANPSDAEPNVGVWHLQMAPPVLVAVYKYEEAKTAASPPKYVDRTAWREALIAFADRQAAFLERLSTV